MAWFWMFKKEITSFFRDKMSLFTFLLIPLLLIGILGASLSNAFGTSDENVITINPMKLYVENLDVGPMGSYLVEQAFAAEQVVNTVLLTDTREQAEVVLIIPENFTEVGWGDGNEQISIHLLTDNPNRIGVKIVESVVEMFLRQTKILYVLTVQQNMPAPIAEDTVDVVVREQSVGSSNSIVSSFAYYAVGMGAMYMLFLGVTASKALMIEIQQKTLQRLLATPQSITALISGKFFGWMLLGILQFSTLILGTKLLYGVEWGAAPLQLFLVIIAFSFAVIALAYLLASIFERAESVDQYGTIAVLIMAVVGGSMAPIYALPDVLNQAAKILPNAWALQTMLDIMLGTDWKPVALAVAVLTGMGLLFIIVGSYRLQRQLKG